MFDKCMEGDYGQPTCVHHNHFLEFFVTKTRGTNTDLLKRLTIKVHI